MGGAELAVTGILFAVALTWLQVCQQLVRKGVASGEVSRKMVHIGTGVLYVLCWPLYSTSCSECHYLAALVPLSVTVKLLLVAFRIIEDEETVRMLCRGGGREMLLKGPLYYGITMVTLTCCFWRSSRAIVPIMLMCGGDGAAAMVGKAVGGFALPWNKQKTVSGSLGFLVFGFAAVTLGMLVSGDGRGGWQMPALGATVVAALVESLPMIDGIDNLIVPMASLLALVSFS